MNAIEKKHFCAGHNAIDDGKHHATITKEVTTGFVEWAALNGYEYRLNKKAYINTKEAFPGRKTITPELLYDQYVISLLNRTFIIKNA